MPYSGIPDSKTKEMESCVIQVMKDPKIKSKYPNHDERKSHAIAICHSSIMGNKKIDKQNAKGGEKNTSVKKTDENTMTKTEEETLKAMDADMKACVMGHMKEGKAMADAKAMCEKAMEGKKVAKADEEAEAPVEEEVKAEEVVADKEEVVVEEEKAEAPVEEAPVEAETVAEADPVGDLVKQVLSKLEDIQASLKKEDDDSVSAEGVAIEPALEVPAENAVVEDQPKADEPVAQASEDVSSEGTEEVAKINDSLTKIADSITNLEKRINALEEQPIPSKIVSSKVVTKGENSVSDTNPRVQEINTELAKIMEMRTKNTEQYQKERGWEKAFDLMAERDSLIK